MYRLLAPAGGEGERKMNQPAGKAGGRRRTMHARMSILLAPG